MPIYAYKCSACGHAQDTLQKMSDAPLTVCPACGAAAYQKQVTAAGFQLKGSGWYVTDFRDGNSKSGKTSESGGKSADAAVTQSADAGSGDKPAAAPAAAASPAPAPAPAAAPAATPSSSAS